MDDAFVLSKSIVQELVRRGYRAFLVGGCVRDLLLGRDPKDYDVATSAPPHALREIFPGSSQVGAHFGVVIVHGEGAHVEVATFRSDATYSDGRRPDRVAFETDPARDAQRRDFTVNALMLDPESNEVFDFAGGRPDLEHGIIRAIGDPRARFEEDHLRLIRAVRFAARLGFTIEPETLAAIQELAPLITRVSAERLRDELTRILTEGHARRGFELLDESGLLPHVLPEIARMKGVAQPPEFHPEGDVWTHTLIMLDGLDNPPATLAWGVLLHDVGKPGTFRVAERIRFDGHVEEGERVAMEIFSRLRFSNDDAAQILALIHNHMRFMDAPRMRESTMKRFLRLPRFDEHLALHRLDCLSSHGSLDNYDYVRRKSEETPPEVLKPAPLITGRDLIALGMTPGPEFKRILDAVEEAQLEGRISTREEALELVDHFQNCADA